jgi:hypothetical protein
MPKIDIQGDVTPMRFTLANFLSRSLGLIFNYLEKPDAQ